MNIDDIEQFVNRFFANRSENDLDGFIDFLSDKLWKLYDGYLMDKIKVAENEIVWKLDLPNAREGVEYNQMVEMPNVASGTLGNYEVLVDSVIGLDEEKQGLKVVISDDGKSFEIFGVPNLEYYRNNFIEIQTNFNLVINYKFNGLEMPSNSPVLSRTMCLIINQDPRKLWQNKPVDWNNMPEPKFQNEDIQTGYIKVTSADNGESRKDIVAASKRGRSHAQEAKPRDDHFNVDYMENGWYIMAVADGAGSAKFSREGSRIACETSVNHCKRVLINSTKFEENIKLWGIDNGSEDAGKLVSADIYGIVGNAALEAHKAINVRAKEYSVSPKLFATTLLLSVCKKFDFGWFVASFWVGDGALCLYDRERHEITLLGTPDEGDYAGQTRFITMPEIFSDPASFYKRLKCRIVPEFTALMLMTDGVSDPIFETDANLNNPDKWDELWDNMNKFGVDLYDDNEQSKERLLDWLDFWVQGHHDDRTIAILY